MRCGEAGEKIGLLSIRSYRPFPLAAVRAALQGAKRVVVLEKSFSVGLGGVVSADVRMALSGLHLHGYTVVAGLGGRAITQASLTAMLTEAIADKLAPLTFLDLNHDIVNRQLAREASMRRSGPIAENLLRDIGGKVRGDSMTQEIKFYQTGTFTVGNRLLDPDQRTVQSSIARDNSLTSGHRACQGCGEALGARYAVDAAMRATKGQLIAANATGCLEVFSTPYPETSWKLPWMHSAVRQCGGGRIGHRGGAEGEGAQGRAGAKRGARHRARRRWRHHRYRLWLPVRHVRAQR